MPSPLLTHVLTCPTRDAAGLPGGLLSQAQLARLGEMAVTAGLQAAGAAEERRATMLLAWRYGAEGERKGKRDERGREGGRESE